MVEYQNKFLKRYCGCLYLVSTRSPMDMALSNLIYLELFWTGRWTGGDQKSLQPELWFFKQVFNLHQLKPFWCRSVNINLNCFSRQLSTLFYNFHLTLLSPFNVCTYYTFNNLLSITTSSNPKYQRSWTDFLTDHYWNVNVQEEFYSSPHPHETPLTMSSFYAMQC